MYGGSIRLLVAKSSGEPTAAPEAESIIDIANAITAINAQTIATTVTQQGISPIKNLHRSGSFKRLKKVAV